MQYTPSRFVRKTLMPEERCTRDARFSWIYTLQAWLLWGLCILAGHGLQLAIDRYGTGYNLVLPFKLDPAFTKPVSIGAVIGLWLFLSMMMKKWTTEIILTTERLIYKRGFLFVKVLEVDIEQLASDTVEQSLIGRIFDYGAIHIRCIEAPDIRLPDIRRPYEFRNALEKAKHDYREHYMKVERLRRNAD